jgi:cell division septum initiation protein DivIVA
MNKFRIILSVLGDMPDPRVDEALLDELGDPNSQASRLLDSFQNMARRKMETMMAISKLLSEERLERQRAIKEINGLLAVGGAVSGQADVRAIHQQEEEPPNGPGATPRV